MTTIMQEAHRPGRGGGFGGRVGDWIGTILSLWSERLEAARHRTAWPTGRSDGRGRPRAAPASPHLAVRNAETPLLLVGADMRVLAASRGFATAFTEPDLEGRALQWAGPASWGQPEILRAVGAVARDGTAVSLETQILCPGGQRWIIIAAIAASAPAPPGSALLAIEDVTASRSVEAVRRRLQEAEVSLLETQHRIANTLMIISGIMRMKARQATSPEAQRDLKNAQQRILTAALIERHLRPGDREEATEIGPFLEALCGGLEESMIDTDQAVRLIVISDPGDQPRRIAVGMGLVLVELVINALKYAFPHGRPGTIRVEYRSSADHWTLTVSDDGIGVGPTPAPGAGGLGAGIVHALAEQLGGALETLPGGRGCRKRLTCPRTPRPTA